MGQKEVGGKVPGEIDEIKKTGGEVLGRKTPRNKKPG